MGNSIMLVVLMKINITEAEIQGLLHPTEANLGYFLAWFQSLQLPSAQSESPPAPKSHVSFEICTQL
jgi:hypothetical protein